MTAGAPGATGGSADPRISVVIPCFLRSEDHLRECLESVRGQRFGDWETIVVDDASILGDVAQVVESVGDARFRLTRHRENRGLGAARNTGYRLARANLVALLDADDKLDPGFLEAALRALEEHSEAGWAFTDWQCFGASIDLWAFPEPLPPPCPHHLAYVGPGAVVRKTVWESVGGYVEEPPMPGAEDWDFWLTASERGFHGVHLTEPLYLHRIGPGAMSVTTSVAHDASNRELLYRRHRQNFDAFDGPCPRCPPRHRVANFLAIGYENSSRGALERGQRLRAVQLAARAVTLLPSRRTAGQLLRASFPSGVVDVLERTGRRLHARRRQSTRY
jgi:hypothetical protein